jgi:catechol 2,3-dioxygenase-like lactoylglutathione lyase family enzyme
LSTPPTFFQRVHHVCVAVDDMDRAVAFYESIGIGPWHDYRSLTEFTEFEAPGYEPEACLGVVYKWAMIGDFQFQLVQPGAGRTPQSDFIDKRGPGLYHIGFAVADLAAAEEEARGFGLGYVARGRRPDGSGFCYFDTRAQAGVTLEIRQSPGTDYRGGAAPADSPPAPTKETPFTSAHHVCVLVPDADRATEYYSPLGISPWAALPPLTDLVSLDGASADAIQGIDYRLAQVPGLQIQLGQPGEAPTPQGKFFAEHGPGVFQFGFSVDDVDRAEAQARDLGLEVLLRGRRADRSGFTYFDTYESAGVVLQVRQTPSS